MSTRRIQLRRSAFRAWLGGQEPAERAGHRRNAYCCPLARFLWAQGARQPVVDVSTFALDAGAGDYLPLPEWAAEFARRTDEDGVGVVTAAEALAVLEAIP